MARDIARCQHCFKTLNSLSGLCRECAHSPEVAAPQAFLFEPTHAAWQMKEIILHEEGSVRLRMADLFYVLWNRLGWPLFDRIAVIPQIGATNALSDIAEELARMLNSNVSREFSLRWIEPFHWGVKRKKNDLLEGKNILLLAMDRDGERLKGALRELWPAFPKQIFIFSVFSFD